MLPLKKFIINVADPKNCVRSVLVVKATLRIENKSVDPSDVILDRLRLMEDHTDTEIFISDIYSSNCSLYCNCAYKATKWQLHHELNLPFNGLKIFV